MINVYFEWLISAFFSNQYIVYMYGSKKISPFPTTSLHVPAERSFPREIFDGVPRLVRISAYRPRWIREA